MARMWTWLVALTLVSAVRGGKLEKIFYILKNICAWTELLVSLVQARVVSLLKCSRDVRRPIWGSLSIVPCRLSALETASNPQTSVTCHQSIILVLGEIRRGVKLDNTPNFWQMFCRTKMQLQVWWVTFSPALQHCIVWWGTSVLLELLQPALSLDCSRWVNKQIEAIWPTIPSNFTVAVLSVCLLSVCVLRKCKSRDSRQ